MLLPSPGRRWQSAGAVHDFVDGLTNWAGDYPNGVTVEGFRLTCHQADVARTTARRRNSTTWRRALVHDHNDGLTLNWASDYPGGVTINGVVSCPASSGPQPRGAPARSTASELVALRNRRPRSLETRAAARGALRR
ncbi:MAG: hypothetical protein R2705_23200 [Ilumatobacteraceae bacterium]